MQPTAPTVVLVEPTAAAVPVVVDSPHSGMDWPADFGTVAPRDAILTTWDAFVAELWGHAPAMGATLIEARFPRAYIDVNRAVDDIDPALIDGSWPDPLQVTDYSRRGMGLIRRQALPDVPMYAGPLAPAVIQRRIAACYRPYRATLAGTLARLQTQFGSVVHINAHSMKSRGNAMNVDSGAPRPDVVVSDRHGTTARPTLTAWAAAWFRDHGLTASVNVPYQGGDIVASLGNPAAGRHSLQIELNRALYMDEARFERSPGFAALQGLLGRFVHDLHAWHATTTATR